jgi:uncharacterized protein YjiS (DUF1127 family)
MTPRRDTVRHSTLSVLEAIRTLGAVLVERIAHAAKILRHRRDLEFLAGLDDRMLKDIGLTRSDLRFALSGPFWRDPGAVLISYVGQRGTGKTRASSVPPIVPAPSRWDARAIHSPARAPRRAA